MVKGDCHCHLRCHGDRGRAVAVVVAKVCCAKDKLQEGASDKYQVHAPGDSDDEEKLAARMVNTQGVLIFSFYTQGVLIIGIFGEPPRIIEGPPCIYHPRRNPPVLSRGLPDPRLAAMGDVDGDSSDDDDQPIYLHHTDLHIREPAAETQQAQAEFVTQNLEDDSDDDDAPIGVSF